MTPSREFAWSTKDGKFHRSCKPMTTDEELMKAVTHRSEQGDACYQSVYKFEDFDKRDTAIVDRIYMDLDNEETPQLAINDAAIITYYFKGHTIQYFSGLKGVGMEILCDTASLLPEMKRDVLRRWTYTVITELGITTADPAVIGDINRVHRVIDTRHQKTGLYAIGLTQSELSDIPIDEIKEMAQQPRGLVQDVTPSRAVSQQLLSIEALILVERLQRFVDRKMLSTNAFDSIVEQLPTQTTSRAVVFDFITSLEDEYKHIVAKTAPRTEHKNKWLAEAEETLLTCGQLTDGKDRGKEHQKRVHFCKYAHEEGYSFREICRAFVNVVDRNGHRCYDERMTESQVRSCIQ